MDTISSEGISIDFNPDGGIIDRVSITIDGQTLSPLHRAPWVESGEPLPDYVAPVERRLAGDFFCAPFALSQERVPIHGWAANGTWAHAETLNAADGSRTATYNLSEAVAGARLSKQIMLIPGHPVIYQTHVFDGGFGPLPVAHHAMIHVPGGARVSFSPKSFGRTPPVALETDPARGRAMLAYPQTFPALSSVRRADGTEVDASLYPFDSGHEDLIVLTENPENRIGWSAAVARADGFLFFAIKDARALPQTVLWMSNGGRYYSPWNSRHLAVLGIEEAATGIHLTAEEANSAPGGVPAAIELDAGHTTEIRYAFGAIPVPTGWSEIADIWVGATAITLVERGGETRNVPFKGSYFGVAA